MPGPAHHDSRGRAVAGLVSTSYRAIAAIRGGTGHDRGQDGRVPGESRVLQVGGLGVVQFPAAATAAPRRRSPGGLGAVAGHPPIAAAPTAARQNRFACRSGNLASRDRTIDVAMPVLIVAGAKMESE